MKNAKTVDPEKIGVDEYIKGAPKEIQPKLRQLRKVVKSAVPEAQEKISYGMPYYGYHGRLAYFAYFKDHLSFFVMSGVLEDFKEEVKDLKTGAATLRLSLNKKLPISLIRKLVKATAKKNERRRV